MACPSMAALQRSLCCLQGLHGALRSILGQEAHLLTSLASYDEHLHRAIVLHPRASSSPPHSDSGRSIETAAASASPAQSCLNPQHQPSSPSLTHPTHSIPQQQPLHPWGPPPLPLLASRRASPLHPPAPCPQQWAALPDPQLRGLKAKVTTEYVALPEPRLDPYNTEPTNYVQLLGALRYAPDLARLQHLLDSYSPLFDGPHVVQALCRLPKLAKYKECDLVDCGIPDLPPGRLSRLRTSLRTGHWVPKVAAQPQPGFRAAAAPLAHQLLALLPNWYTPDELQDMMTDKKEGVKPPRRPGQIEEGPRVPRAGQRRAAVGMAAAARARAAQTRLDPASTAAKRTPRLATEHIAALTWAVGLLHSQGVRLDRARLLSVLDPLLASLARNRASGPPSCGPRLWPSSSRAWHSCTTDQQTASCCPGWQPGWWTTPRP
ncbi:hypothetical protein V8C86DRAFT_1209470 [Haematococcus lacustris]